MTSASKVSELFTAAGEAFTKLAALAQVIQTSLPEGDGEESYTNHNLSSSWTVDDTETLQSAVKRFGDDLSIISEHIKDKTMSQIKSTFKRLQSNASNKGDDSNVSIQYSNSTAKVVSSFEELDSLRVPVNSTERSNLSLGISNNVSESTSSLVGNKNFTKQSNLSNAATNSIIASESSVLSTQINNTPVTVTSSSTPSPFLHYPLLRKSADITLNMLNARDDSDEEDRKAGLSVFNST